MKARFARLIILSAVAALTIVGPNRAANAQTLPPPPCPATPNYTPDFSLNENCMTLNGSAGFVATTKTNTVLRMTPSAGNQTGSAWYSTSQVVNNGFTTTFQFQFTNPTVPPADGIAFVIQSAGTGAIGFTGGNGGALGYGDADASTDPSSGSGIPHSLAIEFDTYENSWDPQAVNGSVSHVAIQSCGVGPNTSHHGYLCSGAEGSPNSTLGVPLVTPNLADSALHNVTISYAPACSTCTPATVANIQVVLDGVNLYPGGVSVDLSSIGLGEGGTAYVGFTGSTGGASETQDIQSWTFAPTQQGSQIDPNAPGSLSQSFVLNNTAGQHEEFDFNYSLSNGNGDLTIQDGTTPFVTPEAISPFDWATIVNGTSLADAPCMVAAGQNVCAVTTLTCSTTANSTPSGEQCPQSTVRNILFNQEVDLALNQPGIVNGILTIPPGYAPALAMAPDVLVSGAQCTFPNPGSLAGQVCPQSILTQLEDNTIKTGGTGKTTNSSYVFTCCEPEWQTTPTIALWSNSTTVPASFTSAPPATPTPNNNNFHAAQGSLVVVGAEPRGVALDTTYPLPGEQSLSNPIPCPALGVSPATPWSTQNPQTFSVSGAITTFDNSGTATPLVEGAYDAHYFSVDCDAFEELVYPASLDIHPGPPGPNVATFKTVPFNIDTTAPNVPSIVLNKLGGFYAQNTPLTATVTCTDPSSSSVPNFFSGIAKCGSQSFGGNQQTVTTTPISLSTSAIGMQTFTATAVDVAGNTSSATVTYQVVGSADLAIGMIGNFVAKTGTNITYYILVANAGPNTANQVTITDAIPSGTTFVSSGYAIDSCNLSGGQPQCSITPPKSSCGGVAGSCNIGTLPAWTRQNPIGAVVQITVKVSAAPNTTITDTATVSEANSDLNQRNNTAKWATLVTK